MTDSEASEYQPKKKYNQSHIIFWLILGVGFSFILWAVCYAKYQEAYYKYVEYNFVVDRSSTADVVDRVQTESEGRLEFIRTEFDGRKSVLFFNGKILRSEEIKLLRIFSDEFGKIPDDKTEM